MPYKHKLVNFSISHQRAQTVANLVIDKYNFPSENLITEAASDSKPLFREDMPAGTKANQRTEISFLLRGYQIKDCNCWIGTVGKGLLRILEDPKNKTLFEISAIASRKKLNFSEKKKFKDILLFSDAEKLINFDGYDILIELIGGDEGIAKKIVFDALNKKKKLLRLIRHLFRNIGKR